MTNSDNDYVQLLEGVTAEPRTYQLRVMSKVLRKFRSGLRSPTDNHKRPAKSVLVESPTGSGKTIMGLAIAGHMQREHGIRVGWSAMRRNLLAQVARENEQWNFNVELKLISMFQKYPPNVDLLVVDEAHHDATRSMEDLHAKIRPRYVLGLTATPFRSDSSRLCFDTVIRDVGIRQLIQDGYLSRYHHFTIPKYTPSAVAGILANDLDRWGKSIVFFHRRDQCEECHQILQSLGVVSEVVTATTDRERQIEDFAEGRIDVLINMLILSEGFDCASLQTVFCRPSSKPCTLQMAGRVFRRHPDLPHKNIVQCKATRHPFIKSATPEEQYVLTDGRWLSLKLNSQIDAVSDRARHLIARACARLPPRATGRRRR